MNIAKAKEQIKNAMQAYFAKDGFGRYKLPPEVQRPVFLMGPPGVGKTAIMKQIAGELGVGLVSYSMTHHTRQSALGLPVIVDRNYGGEACKVSEYTMSEIVASVYDMMEETGVREGILFLDEINCVSETLTPVMLQFLQYKTLGRHQVPAGWIVVTAGNPPEYNRSAREFDLVVWDRLKRIDVEPDYEAFKSYALRKGVHPAVLTYLDAKKEHFYRVEASVEGKRFVTARGWDDLSDMLKLYEEMGIAVDRDLVSQYVQDPDIAEDFVLYYELWGKYRSDYRIEEILSGRASKEIADRAAEAAFDERLSLLGLLLGRVNEEAKAFGEEEAKLHDLQKILKEIKAGKACGEAFSAQELAYEKARRRGGLSSEAASRFEDLIRSLREAVRRFGEGSVTSEQFEELRADFSGRVDAHRAAAEKLSAMLSALFAFCEQVWPDGQEMLILVTELTAGWYSAKFIAKQGCEAYYRHSEALRFYERHTEIIRELEQLENQSPWE